MAARSSDEAGGRRLRRLAQLGAGVVLALLVLLGGSEGAAAGAPSDHHRPEDHEFYPEGSYQDWAKVCVTVLPLIDDPPVQIMRPPGEGLDFDENYPSGTDPDDLTTYCSEFDTDAEAWPHWQVDDYPHGEPFEPSPPGEGECVEILRSWWSLPDTIDGPDDTDGVGDPNPTIVPPDYMVSYCLESGEWRLTDDPFPYDDPNLCVDVLYNEDDRGEAPPDVIAPLEDIDDVGRLDGTDGFYGTEHVQEYCRDGSRWNRSARDDDHPGHDNWRDWFAECVTIVPESGLDPLRSERHPSEFGEVKDIDDLRGVRHTPVEMMVSYCRPDDSEIWYRIDDISVLEETLGPGWDDVGSEGSCVYAAPDRGSPGPEQLGQGQHPSTLMYYDPTVDVDSVDKSMVYCYVQGSWIRYDVLGDLICSTEGEDLGSQGLIPNDCWGSHPSHVYKFTYDGGSWNQFSRTFYGWMGSFFFYLGKGAIQIALWVIGWGYQFDISKFDLFSLNVAEDYQVNLTENASFGFIDMAWFALFGWAAYTALKGRISMAGGEILVSVVLAALVTFFMAHMAGYMSDTWTFLDRSASDVLVAGQGADPEASDDDLPVVVRDSQAQIHEVFIEEPYDYLNWSRSLDGDCAEARDDILARDLHSTDYDEDPAREAMRDAGCEDEADYNEVADGTRMIAAVFYMLVAFVIGLTLLALGITVLAGKFVLLMLFALVPFIALIVILPGGGRRLGWLWLTSLVQAVVVVISMSFLLSMMLLGMQHLLAETEGVGLIERFAVILLVALSMSLARKRILSGTQAAAGRFTDNLTNVRAGGGGAAWQGPTGSSGVNMLGVDRGLHMAGAGVGAAGAGLYRVQRQRRMERRQLRNNIRARRRFQRQNTIHTTRLWGGAASSTVGTAENPEPGYGDGHQPGRRGGGGPTAGPGAGARPNPGPGGNRSRGTIYQSRNAQATGGGRPPTAPGGDGTVPLGPRGDGTVPLNRQGDGTVPLGTGGGRGGPITPPGSPPRGGPGSTPPLGPNRGGATPAQGGDGTVPLDPPGGGRGSTPPLGGGGLPPQTGPTPPPVGGLNDLGSNRGSAGPIPPPPAQGRARVPGQPPPAGRASAPGGGQGPPRGGGAAGGDGHGPGGNIDSGDPRVWVGYKEIHSSSLNPIEMAKDRLAGYFRHRQVERIARREGFDVPRRKQ